MVLKLYWKDVNQNVYMLGRLYRENEKYCFDINESELKNAKALHVCAMLKQKTGDNRFQLLFNAIIGMPSHMIDSIIVNYRKLTKNYGDREQ